MEKKQPIVYVKLTDDEQVKLKAMFTEKRGRPYQMSIRSGLNRATISRAFGGLDIEPLTAEFIRKTLLETATEETA